MRANSFLSRVLVARYLSVLLVAWFGLAGCTPKSPYPPTISNPYAQDTTLYLGSSFWEVDEQTQAGMVEEYLERHFSPWLATEPRESSDSAFWGVRIARKNPGFGENRLPNDPAWIEEMIEEMAMDAYPSRFDAAIMTEDTDMRVFPTNKPRFFGTEASGNGYPFDYWQNSYIFSGTPVRVTHATRKRDWLFVESSFASGWVRAQSVVEISQEAQARFYAEERRFVVPTSDYTPLYDAEERFIEYARIGKLYYVVRDEEGSPVVLIPSRDENGRLAWRESAVETAAFAAFPLRLNTTSIAELARPLLGEKYGWGGLYGNRDCSSLLRDLFGSFGIWLPRNSAAQAKFKEGFINLASLSPEEKEARILEEGVPWATLVWMRGHIMLYIGEYEGRAMLLHDAWGVKSESWFKGEGRVMIGGVTITDLYAGEENAGVKKKSLLVSRVGGMRHLIDFGFVRDSVEEITEEYE